VIDLQNTFDQCRKLVFPLLHMIHPAMLQSSLKKNIKHFN